MLRIGATLLVFLGLFEISRTIYSFFQNDILYAALYLASFMVPVAFFRWFSRGKHTEPMRLGLILTPDTPLLLIAAIGLVLACASLNSLILTPFISPDFNPEDVFIQSDYSTNYNLVVQFIAVALVPGICEEFLFRGMILSNLMPYGKTSAIIISALLFGLMHQNPLQMFYTTMAGILLALIYVYTNSIWCSTLVHICNNGLSVILEALQQRLPEDQQWYVVILDICVYVAAAVSILLLIKNKRKRFSEKPDFRDGIFEKTLPEAVGYQRYPVSPAKKVKLFFTPTIIIFLVMSAIQMLLIFSVLLFGTA